MSSVRQFGLQLSPTYTSLSESRFREFMDAISPLQDLKFDNTLGALLIGLIVSITYVFTPPLSESPACSTCMPRSLFGLTTLQTYLYYREFGPWLIRSTTHVSTKVNYEKDKLALKWLVGIVWYSYI